MEDCEIITSLHTKYSSILPPTLFTSSTKMPYWMYVFENVIFGFAFFYGNRRQNKLLHDVWMGTDCFKISMISCITTRSSPSSNQQLPIMGQLRMFANRIMVEYLRLLGDKNRDMIHESKYNIPQSCSNPNILAKQYCHLHFHWPFQQRTVIWSELCHDQQW